MISLGSRKTTVRTHLCSFSPDDTWQDLSECVISAVHSYWLSPLQGGIATSVEHMLFAETPESVCTPPTPTPTSPGFQATRLFKPSACGWSNSHEGFHHTQHIKLPLSLLCSPVTDVYHSEETCVYQWLSFTSVSGVCVCKIHKLFLKTYIVIVWLIRQLFLEEKAGLCGRIFLNKCTIICGSPVFS